MTRLLDRGGVDSRPRTYDAYSVRTIEEAGAKVIYMTGSGSVASPLGPPDPGLATMTEMVEHAENMASTGPITTRELEAMGYRIAIFPSLALRATAWNIRNVAGALLREGSTKSFAHQMMPFDESDRIRGPSASVELEKRFLSER